MENNKKRVEAGGKPSKKRNREAMEAPSSSAAPVPVAASAAAPIIAAKETGGEKPKVPAFPCPMKCPDVFSSEKAMLGHVKKLHPAPSPDEAGGAVVMKKPHPAPSPDEGGGAVVMKKPCFAYDLNELPPPEEDDEAAQP